MNNKPSRNKDKLDTKHGKTASKTTKEVNMSWFKKLINKIKDLIAKIGGTQTPPPGEETPPELTPLPDIGSKFQCWYGRVNTWASGGESNLAKDISECAKNGVKGYMIELMGWARSDVWSTIWLKDTERMYKYAVEQCRKNNIWLFVSVVNDNMGSGKYGDPGIPLSKVMAQAQQLCQMVKTEGKDNVVVQPVAETGSSAGKSFEQYCIQNLPGFIMVYNGGSRPSNTPSGYKYRAWHPFKTSDKPPADSIVVSDTGSIITQLGDGLEGKAHPEALEAWAKSIKANKNPVCGYYAFKFNGHDAEAIKALGKVAK